MREEKEEASMWQPIDTAPKDGTWIIVSGDGRVEPACWEQRKDDDGHSGWCAAGSSYGGVLYDIHYELEFNPTHWMPLPPAPQPRP